MLICVLCSGFKTFELKLIGPALLIIGFVLVFFKILQCMFPDLLRLKNIGKKWDDSSLIICVLCFTRLMSFAMTMTIEFFLSTYLGMETNWQLRITTRWTKDVLRMVWCGLKVKKKKIIHLQKSCHLESPCNLRLVSKSRLQLSDPPLHSLII